MTLRENVNAILHYEKYDHFPVVSFGYWKETVEKWAQEGHITWKKQKAMQSAETTPMQISPL